MSESGCLADDVPSASTRRLRSAGASSLRHQEAARGRVLDLLSGRQLGRWAGPSSNPHTVDVSLGPKLPRSCLPDWLLLKRALHHC